METIRLQATVTSSGLMLESSELLKFLNQKVDIKISPIEKEKNNSEKLLKFASKIDIEDAMAFEIALEECRQIDLEGWNEELFD